MHLNISMLEGNKCLGGKKQSKTVIEDVLEEGVNISYTVAREHLTEKGVCKQIAKEIREIIKWTSRERASHTDSKCKGPEAEKYLGNQKKTGSQCDWSRVQEVKEARTSRAVQMTGRTRLHSAKQEAIGGSQQRQSRTIITQISSLCAAIFLIM